MEILKNIEIIENFNLLSYPLILIDNKKNIVWCNKKADSLIDKKQLIDWLTVFENSLDKKIVKIDNNCYELEILPIVIESKNYLVLNLFYISDNKKIFDLLSEQLTEAILICNDKITYTNTALENLLGYNKEYLIGKNFSDLLDDENKAILNKNLEYLFKYKKNQIKFILSIEKKNAKRIWISVKTKYITENDVPFHINVISNISSKKTQ